MIAIEETNCILITKNNFDRMKKIIHRQQLADQ